MARMEVRVPDSEKHLTELMFEESHAEVLPLRHNLRLNVAVAFTMVTIGPILNRVTLRGVATVRAP
jgi:hypothetical protein